MTNDNNSIALNINTVAFIGNYLPRQCGIATFTTDLCEAVTREFVDTRCFAVPVTDIKEGYDYPPRVRFELLERDIQRYRQAAEFVNLNNVDLVCLQHEYGIFGGVAGSHILGLLRDLRVPLVTTLHTVLREPDVNQRRVMMEILDLSDRVVVMSNRAIEYLAEIYEAPREKIDLIHHGIPDVPFIDPNYYKDKFGVAGNLVMLTFGLLAPDKGIEYVIKAMPAILKDNPDVVYIVVGATHPQLRAREGEAYRLEMQRLASSLGVEEHVIFHNRFVTIEELIEYIGAADIYVTPYLKPTQIVSGTLAYTVGAGKAIISTPYWYAEELLAENRGLMVPFRDADAIAAQVKYLIGHEVERHAMRKNAYQFGRQMIWPLVAQRYMENFKRAKLEHTIRPAQLSPLVLADRHKAEYPPLRLDHLMRMTDSVGIYQHAIHNVPNYAEGYTTDDNARALMLAVMLNELLEEGEFDLDTLVSRYLAFLFFAYNPEIRRFRNFMSFDRRWLEEVGSEDSHGRALVGLGMIIGRWDNEGHRRLACQLFESALTVVAEFHSPRAWAFTLIAIHEYLRAFSGDLSACQIRSTLAEKLFEMYQRNSVPEWPWFEESLTYANARLPHALLLCGQWMNRPDYTEIGLKSLGWLMQIYTSEAGYFSPVGCNGFFPRGGVCARFDQQPLEAQSSISACLEAWRMTRDGHWKNKARRAFDWFIGLNDLGMPVYNPASGGCYDGLLPDRLNGNQGAESTLAFLLSLAEMRMAEGIIIRSDIIPPAGDGKMANVIPANLIVNGTVGTPQPRIISASE